jgi:GTP-binding protein
MKLFASAGYKLSAHFADNLPADTGAEVAFAGRSNSGKSSAINALVGQKRLAHVSRTPGRTQAINFFSLGSDRSLVDLPGYGYARVPLQEKHRWEELISAYITTRRALRGLVVVMDARHAFGPLDGRLLDWTNSMRLRAHVLLSKADKLGFHERRTVLARAHRGAQVFPEPCAIQFFSSKSGEGVDQARAIIARWLGLE